jgi:hypothetical protein
LGMVEPVVPHRVLEVLVREGEVAQGLVEPQEETGS